MGTQCNDMHPCEREAEGDLKDDTEWRGFPGDAGGKEPACQCRRCKRYRFDPWVKKMPWRRNWQSSLIFLPGELHGQRSLAGYNLWGCKELDTTEVP